MASVSRVVKMVMEMAALLAVRAVFPAAGMAQREQDCSLDKEASPPGCSSPLSATTQKSKTGDFQAEKEGVY